MASHMASRQLPLGCRKRNLALLTPFLMDARIELRTLGALGPDGDLLPPPPFWAAFFGGGQRGQRTLRATWLLTCYLRLPWKPYIEVNGSTEYLLNEDQNQVGERRGPVCARAGAVQSGSGGGRHPMRVPFVVEEGSTKGLRRVHAPTHTHTHTLARPPTHTCR